MLITNPSKTKISFILTRWDLVLRIENVCLNTLAYGSALKCPGVKEVTVHPHADIREKIADRQRIQGMLAATATHCFGDTVHTSPMLDTLAR